MELTFILLAFSFYDHNRYENDKVFVFPFENFGYPFTRGPYDIHRERSSQSRVLNSFH